MCGITDIRCIVVATWPRHAYWIKHMVRLTSWAVHIEKEAFKIYAPQVDEHTHTPRGLLPLLQLSPVKAVFMKRKHWRIFINKYSIIQISIITYYRFANAVDYHLINSKFINTSYSLCALRSMRWGPVMSHWTCVGFQAAITVNVWSCPVLR